MIELDNFTIGILIIFAIVAIMIITAKMHQGRNMTATQQKPISKPLAPKIPVNLWENNRAQQMHMMNMKYENIVDDLVDYNNKPTGLFVIP